MTTHKEFLELAAAAIDFPLAPADRRRLEEHLHGCASCPTAAAAMRRDAAQFASIPVLPLSDRHQAALLRSVVRQPETHPMRLVAIAALLGLALVGSLIAGAQLIRRPDDDLSLVVPVHSATATPSTPVDSSPSPFSPSPSAAPTPAEAVPPSVPVVVLRTPEPDADSVPIAPDSIGVVLTNDLRVRSKPEVSDTSEKLTPLLQEGEAVFIVDGPVSGSGYEWYLVAPLETSTDGAPFGWVAVADKNGDAWLGTGSVDCPPAPDTFAEFVALEPGTQTAAIAITCFADREISFPARIMRPEATCGVDPGWGIEPSWIGGVCTPPQFLFMDPDGSTDEMRDAIIDPALDTSGFDPGVEPSTGINVRLTGHWDDPAARDCTVVVTDADNAFSVMTPEQAVLSCRSQFVITSMAAVAR